MLLFWDKQPYQAKSVVHVEHRFTFQPSDTSNHDVMRHASMHIGKPEVAARIAISQVLVVDAQQMQDRGMEIVYMYWILLHQHAQFVAGAIASILWKYQKYPWPPFAYF